MIVAEGVLIGSWIVVWATIWLFIKILARGSWISTSLGVLV